MDKRIRLEWQYSCGNGASQVVFVSVNPSNVYTKDVEFILELLELLRAKLPLGFRENGKPKVEVLGGDYRKGMISVEMMVPPLEPLKDFEASVVKAFEAAGFERGVWPTM